MQGSALVAGALPLVAKQLERNASTIIQSASLIPQVAFGITKRWIVLLANQKGYINRNTPKSFLAAWLRFRALSFYRYRHEASH